MSKYSALGGLIGIFLGVIIYLMFPKLLSVDFLFNKTTRTYQGFSEGQYYYKSGSVLVVGYLFPVIFGVLGWLIGHLYSKSIS